MQPLRTLPCGTSCTNVCQHTCESRGDKSALTLRIRAPRRKAPHETHTSQNPSGRKHKYRNATTQPKTWAGTMQPTQEHSQYCCRITYTLIHSSMLVHTHNQARLYTHTIRHACTHAIKHACTHTIKHACTHNQACLHTHSTLSCCCDDAVALLQGKHRHALPCTPHTLPCTSHSTSSQQQQKGKTGQRDNTQNKHTYISVLLL